MITGIRGIDATGILKQPYENGPLTDERVRKRFAELWDDYMLEADEPDTGPPTEYTECSSF